MSATSLFLSLVISTIGFAYFSYGRKRPAPVFLVAGLIMMVYGYFVESPAWSAAIGVALGTLPFLIRT